MYGGCVPDLLFRAYVCTVALDYLFFGGAEVGILEAMQKDASARCVCVCVCACVPWMTPV